MWWLQRRDVRIASCSLRGAAAAQLQGLTECVNETTNNRHAPCGEAGERNKREGDEERRARIAASTTAPLPPGPGAFLPDRGYVGRFLHSSEHRQTQSTLASLAKASSSGCQNLTRRLTEMTVRQVQANARISRTGTTFDGRTSGIFRGTPSRQPALQNVKVHRGTGSYKFGDRTAYSQSTSNDDCGVQRISRNSSCHFTCLLDSVPRGHSMFLPFDSKSDRRTASQEAFPPLCRHGKFLQTKPAVCTR